VACGAALETIDVSENPTLSGAGILTLLSRCHNLTGLRMRNFGLLALEFPEWLRNASDRLTLLDVRCERRYGGVGILVDWSTLPVMPRLETLNASHLSANDVALLPTRLPNIETLVLESCPITTRWRGFLCTTMPRLSKLCLG
jgi:hypothetical protein